MGSSSITSTVAGFGGSGAGREGSDGGRLLTGSILAANPQSEAKQVVISLNSTPPRGSYATGAQSTFSISGAPVASITSRSNPSAIPAAGGMPWASAARKSSSIG